MTAAGHGDGRPRPAAAMGRVAFVFAAVLAAYWPALQGGFIWDDDAHVTRPALRSLHGLWRIWTELGATQQYYPVLHSAFWIEHRLWGDSAPGYHLLNVLLHAAAACLLALVLGRLFRDRTLPWLAALIFALHPVCVESVAWISEQKNTLSMVLYLLAGLAYLKWRGCGPGPGAGEGDPESRRPLYYWLATGLFVLALLAKSVTATLPAALLVVLWWRRGRLSWRSDVLPLLPWFVLGSAAGILTAWVERRYIGAGAGAGDPGFWRRCLMAGRIAWFYPGKLVWPSNLVFIYPRWPAGPGAEECAGSLGAVAVIAALWGMRGRARGPLAAALLFAGALFPALGFLDVYPFVFSWVADHFQYLAVPVFAAAAAGGWGAWHRRSSGGRGSALPAAAAAAGVLVLGVLSWRQCRIYRSEETLYGATLRGNPGCWLAHDNLGVVLEHSGRAGEAIAHYREAVRLKPDYPEAYNNLGNALARMGRWEEAEAQYAQAVRVRPDFAAAEFDWGNALGDSGRYAGAVLHYGNALRLLPGYPEAEYRLANALANEGRLDEAMAHYARAIALRADYPEAEANLGLALALAGRPEEALAHVGTAVRLRPGYAEAHTCMAIALARMGRYSEAVDECRISLRLDPGSAEAHYQLGAALKALGRLSEAADEFQLAERPAPR